MAGTQLNTSAVKNIESPDETRTFSHGNLKLVNIAGGTVGLMTFDPGWKWSNDVKPIAGTDLCQVTHFGYQVSGRMLIKMADGREFEMGPGSVGVIPAGHDAWVLGDEPVVMVDWAGAGDYAKK